MNKRFVGIFAKQKKDDILNQSSGVEAPLYPVLSANKLLGLTHRHKLLQDLRLLVQAPSEQYTVLYQQLINQFAEFVQLLPYNAAPLYQREGGILDYGLERAYYAVEIRKDYKLPLGGAPSVIQQKNAVWTYALFSGSLLYNIGEAVGRYRVHLFDKLKKFTQQWYPYDGSMLPQGEYYKFWMVSDADARQYRTTTSLFARQLMPQDGFSWIASDPNLFNMWLALLNGDSDAAGILEIIYYKAFNKLLHEKAEENEVTYDSVLEQLSEEAKQAHDLDEAEDTKAGEAFLHWLVDGIERKTISVNQRDSQVHMTSAGVFLLHPEIFKNFINYSHGKFTNWVVVAQQFNMLGFAKLSGEDYRFEQFFGGQKKQGIIIEDTRGLFASNKVPQVNAHAKPVAYQVSDSFPQLTQALNQATAPQSTLGKA